MSINKRILMMKAHEIRRKHGIGWGEALHRAYNCQKVELANHDRIAQAKRAAGIPAEAPTHTWKQWHDLGYEVAHGSKARFQVALQQPSYGDHRLYIASFFTFNQVRPIGQAQ